MSFEQTVARIRDSIDIVDVISRFVALKRSGRNFKGLCPFHSEKTPSFMVSQEKQIFRCFGCGMGGDVIKFVQEYEKLPFMDAMRMLASQAGIELDTTPEKRARRDEKELFAEINKLACAFYIKTLKDEGRKGFTFQYLEKRGISLDSIERFQIGLAPSGWQALLDFLDKKGFSGAQVESAGLAIKNDRGGFYDRFRGRLMFPIQSLSGAVIGFGARVFDDSQPKYINSPENAAFIKSRTLYGLNFARREVIDRGFALLGEGYFDVIRAHQEGFENTVASLGTAFTREHCAIIKRYASDVVLAYDGDKAGQGAAVRGGDIFVQNGVRVKVAVFPGGHDPDSFLRDEGKDAFSALIDSAPGLFDFRLEWLGRQFDIATDKGRVEITRRMMEFVSPVSDPILKDLYVKKLSDATGISAASLLAEDRARPGPGRRRKTAEEKAGEAVRPEEDAAVELGRAEEDLLRVVLVRPALALRALEEIVPGLGPDDPCLRLLKLIADKAGEDGIDLPPLVDSLGSAAEKNLITRLALDNQDIRSPEVFYNQIAIKMQMGIQRVRYQRTLEEIKKIEKMPDPDGKNIQKILQLNQDLVESKVFLCNLEKKLVSESSKFIIDSSLSG